MANLRAWLAAHKVQAAGGVAAAVAGLAFYRRHHTGPSSATSAATGSAGGLNGSGTGMATFDSSQLDQYNQLASAISNLNDQVSTIEAGNAAGSAGQLPPSSSGQGLSPQAKNLLEHDPVKGYTGQSWSKLTWAQKENAIAHTPAAGFTGLEWSRLSLPVRENIYAALDTPSGPTNGLVHIH